MSLGSLSGLPLLEVLRHLRAQLWSVRLVCREWARQGALAVRIIRANPTRPLGMAKIDFAKLV